MFSSNLVQVLLQSSLDAAEVVESRGKCCVSDPVAGSFFMLVYPRYEPIPKESTVSFKPDTVLDPVSFFHHM